MALIRWGRELFDELDEFRRQMGRFFEEGLNYPESSGWFLGGGFPPVVVSTVKDNIYVRAELPGVKREDVDLSISGNSLAIKGIRDTGLAQEGTLLHRREREYGSFSRIINLPDQVDTDKATASYEHGILTVILPKPEEVKPKRIAVGSPAK